MPKKTKNAISLPKMRQLSCELATAKAQNRAEAICSPSSSQQTSARERGDRLLQGETAGKQLVTDNANVPILGALLLPHHLNDRSCTFLLSFVPASLRWLSVRAYGCICIASVYSYLI